MVGFQRLMVITARPTARHLNCFLPGLDAPLDQMEDCEVGEGSEEFEEVTHSQSLQHIMP